MSSDSRTVNHYSWSGQSRAVVCRRQTRSGQAIRGEEIQTDTGHVGETECIDKRDGVHKTFESLPG